MTGMRKIVIAPDSFKGSVAAREVADSAERAVREVFPACEVVKIPLGDGGEGTMDALLAALGGERVSCRARDPLSRPLWADYAILEDGRTAIVEMARASGLPLLAPAERDPSRATTYGTGELIRDALERGCRRFLLAIGGSATNDGGTGLLRALGYRFLDGRGEELEPCGAALARIAAVDRSGVSPALREASFTVACDVDNPLYGERGAAEVFARQKGADDAMVRMLDAGLRNYARVIERATGTRVDELPGAGAAGGLGAGLVAFLGAELKPGIQMVLEATRFDERIQGADLIITGEGKLDRQTCMGKAPWGVSRAATRQGIPVIALGGSVEDTPLLNQRGFLAVLSILPAPVSLERAMDKDFTLRNIQRTVEQALRILDFRFQISNFKF